MVAGGNGQSLELAELGIHRVVKVNYPALTNEVQYELLR